MSRQSSFGREAGRRGPVRIERRSGTGFSMQDQGRNDRRSRRVVAASSQGCRGGGIRPGSGCGAAACSSFHRVAFAPRPIFRCGTREGE